MHHLISTKIKIVIWLKCSFDNAHYCFSFIPTVSFFLSLTHSLTIVSVSDFGLFSIQRLYREFSFTVSHILLEIIGWHTTKTKTLHTHTHTYYLMNVSRSFVDVHTSNDPLNIIYYKQVHFNGVLFLSNCKFIANQLKFDDFFLRLSIDKCDELSYFFLF